MTKHDRTVADLVYRSCFGAFVYEAFRTLNPGRCLVPNWHIDAVCLHLERMLLGEAGQRFVLNQPPRSLKSFIVSVCFPAWGLGYDPTLDFVGVSYADDLSCKFSRDCRTLMGTAFYRRVFPGTRFNASKLAESEFETTAGGGRFTTSIHGGLTGRGADFLIVDDPIKAQDSQSELARNTVAEWLNGAAYSRRNEPGESSVIVTMQRLHADDLSGRLIAQGWPSLVLPAIATEAATYAVGEEETYSRQIGELLQPQRDRLDDLNETKTQIGSLVFEAQYQQNPTPPGGNIIKKEWLKYYKAPLERDEYRTVILGCDPAGKPGEHNDYTAIVIAGITDQELHVLHATRGHWTACEIVERIKELVKLYRVDSVRVEETAMGTAIVQDLSREQGMAVIGVNPTKDKVSRLYAQQGLFESEQVLLPINAWWSADFERELLDFPNARYDDQVDALLLLLEWFRRRPAPEVLCGPIIVTGSRTPWWDNHN